MGPKAFITCYVCFREFGSRSIPFHEPKCLERWRSSNRSLPPEKRSSTPVKPVGWKYSTESTWICTNCQISVPAAKRGEHAGSCFKTNRNSSTLLDKQLEKAKMTIEAQESNKEQKSPKKGKENKNNSTTNSVNSNYINSPVKTLRNYRQIQNRISNAKNDDVRAKDNEQAPQVNTDPAPINDAKDEEKNVVSNVSTSNRSVRPQTKVLRRPTPNLKHPVIQVDSDDSGDSTDKSKEENTKRLKINNENNSWDHKPKNFIMYNKYNVEKNIKNSPKERAALAKEASVTSSATATNSAGSNSIPYPCNSCTRSVAPERLHSHTRKDARGMMLKKLPSADSKQASPQRKSDVDDKKAKDPKNAQPEALPTSTNSKTDVDKAVVKSNKGTNDKRSEKLRSNVNCRICNKSIRASALNLHTDKCLERWNKENGSNTSSPRKVSPEKLETHEKTTEEEKQPKVEKIDESDVAWLVVQSQFVPCPSCGRTFFPERLPVHQRVCKGKPNPHSLSRTPSLREQLMSGDDEEGEGKPTLYVPCYICSRNFGSWVIQMHESQCLRKWRRENEKLPEHLQQQEPHKPQLVLADDGQSHLELSEDIAWESHLQQLVPCPQCSRTFFPDRLKVHLRSCKGLTQKHPRNNKLD